MKYLDISFQVGVYLLCFYLFTQNTIYLKLAGLIILIGHFCKDCFKFKNWHPIANLFGVFVATILIFKSCQLPLQLLGFLMFFTHTRQLVVRDNFYYYSS